MGFHVLVKMAAVNITHNAKHQIERALSRRIARCRNSPSAKQPRVGHLDEISKHDVIAFHHGMRAKGYALGTCNRCLILLRYALNLAVRWEIPGVTANPTKDVPLFENPNKKERFLSQEEAQKLYQAIASAFAPPVLALPQPT